jgi:hypothetical protein
LSGTCSNTGPMQHALAAASPLHLIATSRDCYLAVIWL